MREAPQYGRGPACTNGLQDGDWGNSYRGLQEETAFYFGTTAASSLPVAAQAQ